MPLPIDAMIPVIRRRFRLALSLTALFFALGVCVWLNMQDELVGFLWDDAHYLAIADWLNPFSNSPPHVVNDHVSARPYPIAYPVVLAIFGASFDHVSQAFLAHGLIVFASYTVVFWYLRRTIGNPRIAWLLGLSVILSASSIRLTSMLISEHLYVLVSLAALTLWLDVEQKPSRIVWVGLLCGVAAATRSIGIALTLTFVVFAVRRRHFFAATAPLPPLLLNQWVHSLLGMPTYAASFFPRLSEQTFMEYVWQQGAGFLSGWHSALAIYDVPPLRWFMTGLLVLACAGWVLRVMHRQPDAVYLGVYLGIILIWPYPEQFWRFIYPVLPILLVCVWQVCVKLSSITRCGHALYGLCLLVAATVSLPNASLVLTRLATPLPDHLAPLRNTWIWLSIDDRGEAMHTLEARYRWLADMRLMRKVVPEDSCIATEMVAVVWIQTRRVTRLSPWHSIAEASRNFSAAGCEYYYWVPLMLSGPSSPDQVADFLRSHQILHVSQSPRDPAEKLGVLIRFVPRA